MIPRTFQTKNTRKTYHSYKTQLSGKGKETVAVLIWLHTVYCLYDLLVSHSLIDKDKNTAFVEIKII